MVLKGGGRTREEGGARREEGGGRKRGREREALPGGYLVNPLAPWPEPSGPPDDLGLEEEAENLFHWTHRKRESHKMTVVLRCFREGGGSSMSTFVLQCRATKTCGALQVAAPHDGLATSS